MTSDTWVKTALRQFRGDWKRLPVSDIPTWVASIPDSDFRTGAQAVYIGTRIRNESGESVWLVLDVERKGDHYDIRANLEAGREVLAFLFDNGLTDCLIILLSGWGLRFCWPFMIGAADIPAFMEFVSERPEIDASIYGVNPLRIGGYRGNVRQCRVDEAPTDRHIHKLQTINDLWLMTKSDYLTLTGGRPELADCLSWLPEILPTKLLPDAWVKFLEPYKESVELRGTLFSGMRPAQSKAFRPIPEILEGAGMDFTEEQSGETVYYRLKRDCPSCGNREGRAWVTSGGRLRCWRATCLAGTKEGLPLSVWLPGADVFLDHADLESESVTGETVAVEAARAAIRAGIESGRDIACAVTPGGGKSTTTLKALLADGLSGRIFFGVPEKSLGRELIETAKVINPDVDVVMLEGRSSSNCKEFAKVERVASLGFAPAFLVCPSCKRKNPDCQYFTDQAAAFAPGDRLVITSHAGLLNNIDWTKNGFNRMVIDESPMPTFITTKAVPWGAVQRISGKIDPAGRKIIARIDAAILKQLATLEKNKRNRFTISRLYGGTAPVGSQWDGKKSIWDVAKIKEGMRSDLLRALSIFEPLADDGAARAESQAAYQRRLYKQHINLDGLQILWGLIAGTQNTYVNFTQDKNNPVSLCQTTKTLPIFDGQIIHLDGTLDPDETRSLLERDFNLIDGRCELPGLKSIWIRQGGGKLKMARMNDAQLERMLKSTAVHLPESTKSVFIGTHFQVEDSVKAIGKNVMRGRMVDSVHYFSSRGRNEWQGFDAFIAAGTPALPESGMLDTGFILFPGDADKQAGWRANLGSRELIQAAHRIRPINGGKTIIVVGREWPQELGQPGITIDRRRGDRILDSAQKEAIERLMLFVREFGFIHRETMWANGVCLESETDVAAITFNYWLETFPKFPFSSQSQALLTYYIYRGKLRLKRGSKSQAKDTSGMIIFRNRKSIDDILHKLQESTGLPGLKYSSKLTGGHKTDGLGYLESVRNFYGLMAVPWAAESWQGTESPSQNKGIEK